MNRSAIATKDDKRAAEELTAIEEGDEISVVIDGDYNRGVVDEVDNETEFTAEIVFDTFDSKRWAVFAEYNGDPDAGHFETDAEDFEVFACTCNDPERRSVDSVVNWDNGLEAPSKTIEEVEGEKADEMRDELESSVESARRATEEIQAIHRIMTKALYGDITFAAMEEAMVELEAESGGELELQARW